MTLMWNHKYIYYIYFEFFDYSCIWLETPGNSRHSNQYTGREGLSSISCLQTSKKHTRTQPHTHTHTHTHTHKVTECYVYCHDNLILASWRWALLIFYLFISSLHYCAFLRHHDTATQTHTHTNTHIHTKTHTHTLTKWYIHRNVHVRAQQQACMCAVQTHTHTGTTMLGTQPDTHMYRCV